jgi:hypothetical protein
MVSAIFACLASAAFMNAQPTQNASPFMPPAGAATAIGDHEAKGYELVGVTAAGDHTLLSIFRQSDQRSTWIPVGKTVAGITVVRYDPAKDEAVIHADEKDFTLTLRKAQIVSTEVALQPAAASPLLSPASLTATTMPGDPAVVKLPPMSAQEEKEMEARMLVSDLLEIGLRQRAAYQEVRRQAAQKNTTTAASPATAAK